MARLRLYSIYEIAKRYGFSKGTAGYYSRRPGFPEPLDTLSTGRVWQADEVEDYFEEVLRQRQDELERRLSGDEPN